MFYRIRAGILMPCTKQEMYNRQDSYIAVNHMQEPLELIEGNAARALVESAFENQAIRFESREGVDLICFGKVAFPHHKLRLDRVYMLFGPGWLQVVCQEDGWVKSLIDSFAKEKNIFWTLGKVIVRLFESQGNRDVEYLEYLEGCISELEDKIITGKEKTDYVKSIIHFRKHLMRLRQIYEQTFDLLEDFSENENGLLDGTALKYVKIYANKIDRLYDRVGRLQEYVTEIRDAYQAQVDISLNRVMKFFTVITSIFLPLTLIAGWYGMNLRMPEYGWEWGYPVVITVSVLLVIVEIIYFKKNKWF